MATESPDDNANLIARAKVAVTGLLGDEIIDAEPIARGFVHDNIRARLASGREVIVKFPYFPRQDRMERIQRMFARLREEGVGCPDVLAADVTGERGEPCLILSWLPGETLSDAWPTLTDAERQAIGRDIGDWTARLHAIRFPEIGQGTLLARDLSRRLQLARESGLIEEAQLATAEAVIAPVAAARLHEPARAIHADFYLDNIIIDGEPGARRMAGAIDFDRLMPEDPTREFIKFRWWVFDAHPELEAPLLAGYLDAGGEPEAISPDTHRARALELLEVIGSLVYFTARAADPIHGYPNDARMAADARRRFDGLMAAGYADLLE